MSVFFDQLQTFSERVFQTLEIGEITSPWQGGQFQVGEPIGAILHYTANSSIRGTLRWFMSKKHEAQASAHVVIADGWPEEYEELAVGLPLVRALPAAVVQCVAPGSVAWHATWVNSMCYGIELVNAGELRLRADGWVWWPDDWTRPWKAKGAVPKVPVEMYGRAWEPYTAEQILAVVIILREVQKFHGSLRRYMVLGHEHVSQHKLDPGPLLPLHGIRLAVHEPDIYPSMYQWFQHFQANTRDGQTWRDTLAHSWVSDVLGQPGRSTEDAWREMGLVLRGPFMKSNAGFGLLGRTVLRLLGYFASPTFENLTDDERRSIEVFQRMMRLRVDGIPGINTKAGLVLRLEEQGILPVL